MTPSRNDGQVEIPFPFFIMPKIGLLELIKFGKAGKLVENLGKGKNGAGKSAESLGTGENAATVVTSPNIALIKYWGKRDDLLKLPMNDSISITLDNDVLCTRTTLVVSDELKCDKFVLNGKIREDAKIAEALTLIRKRLQRQKKGFLDDEKVLLISGNNFPTSGGVASSASGFCAIAEAACAIYGITDAKELSIMARYGSGSASRSVFGGFVRWNNGTRKDGEDSFAVQIAPKSHWPEIVDVLAIISKKEKKVGSKEGMENTARQSGLLPARVEGVRERVERMQEAIMGKDLATLCELAMRDSNNMHATMLDSWPPVFYLNESSRQAIEAVHEFNSGEIKAGYTFDAGPNAHIITTKKHEREVVWLLREVEGVGEVVCAPVGDGPAILKADKKLVDEWMGKI